MVEVSVYEQEELSNMVIISILTCLVGGAGDGGT